MKSEVERQNMPASCVHTFTGNRFGVLAAQPRLSDLMVQIQRVVFVLVVWPSVLMADIIDPTPISRDQAELIDAALFPSARPRNDKSVKANGGTATDQLKGFMSNDHDGGKGLANPVFSQARAVKRAILAARHKLALNPKDYRNHMLLGQLLSLAGDPDKDAERILRQAAKLGAQHGDVWVALVAHLMRRGRRDEAAAATVQAKQKLPLEEHSLTLARCYDVLGRRDLAAQHYFAALSVLPDDAHVLRRVANFCLRTKQPDKAERLLRRVLEPDFSASSDVRSQARRELSLVLYRGSYQQFREAVGLLGRGMPTAEESPADLRLKARLLTIHPRLQNLRESAALLSSLHERGLLRTSDRLLLAMVLEQMGEETDAEPHWQKLLATHAENRGIVELYVQSLIRRKEPGKAQQWLDRLPKPSRSSLDTVRLQVAVLVDVGETDKALEQLHGYLGEARGARERTGRTVQVAFLIDELARRLDKASDTRAARGRLNREAERLYREYLAMNPADVLAFVAFLSRQQRFDEAVELCEHAWTDYGSVAVLSATVAMLRTGQTNQGQTARMEQLVESVRAKNDGSTQICRQLARLREYQQRYSAAIGLYRQTLADNPSDVRAVADLARLLALTKTGTDEAAQLIGRALKQAGPSPELLETQAIVFLASGQFGQSVAALNAALQETETPRIHFYLALAEWKSGNLQAARKHVDRAAKAGLVAQEIHPLQRDTYHEMVADIGE
jgi:tetratricopeptide (TPR) repeat protein